MRTRILIGCAVVASAGLGAFAATGFGDGGEAPAEVEAVTVQTHRVEAPPAGAPKVAARRASLFKVIYKETDSVSVAAGYQGFTLRACPRGSGILSAWHLRVGANKAGLLSAGSSPDGLRKWEYVVNNVSGSYPTGTRFGIICIK